LRDELIQRQYLRAMHGFWNNPVNNPESDLYDGRMIDMSRAFVWAWDARPYPWFPNNEVLWSDGPNYRRGHWINGRVSARTLESVVREICDRAGVKAYDTSRLFGIVRGYSVPHVADARRALQPLMLAYGFDAIERGGALHFRMRDGKHPVELRRDDLAVCDEIDGDLQETRGPSVEMSGRVRLRFVQADGDHQVVAEETVLPDDETHAVAETELDLALTRAEGRQTLERWLSEARIARDTLRFALPPSKLALGAGDIISVTSDSGATLARIDRVEVTHQQLVDAVRIDPGLYKPSHFPDEAVNQRPFVPAGPVMPIFLDLPLMTGEEVPHAPHLALFAKPWPGSVAVYDSATDADYSLNEIIAARSSIGISQTALFSAPSGRLDRGAALQVKIDFGALESISDAALLAGGNLMAIGDGSSENWELFQFRDAEMIGPQTWLLSHRLRGQLGSDGIMPDVWPEGAQVVLLDGVPQQIALAPANRRLARHYRIGPAQRAFDDPSYVEEVRAFDGIGMRPYSPVHLTVTPSSGSLQVSWVRRTRIDGDSWDLDEVPLGEESERYLVRILQNDTVIREAQTTSPAWIYSAAMRSADAVAGDFRIAVAQVSARFGPGPFEAVTITE
uniref:phage tail protein n=1 Tax=Puniceibacterium confluentis TaxID=1958944 RepID=UPI0035652C07